ncbi:hypothetical protein IEQ34_010346 [Dendrobium chrysotoxum]|uniref:Uncharacterized protein n=1 Tax=Dendrobium chrysotoxum TaxID=161865 RepID=A0AAV7H2U6_DENCH|nr:hypothetical protein IEQ34_010346 [Dendrobium chrysotoxum]
MEVKNIYSADCSGDIIFLESLTLVLLGVSPCPVGQMNISQAHAKTTGASAAIICTSSSAFIIFLMRASGRLWFLKILVCSISRY